MGSTPTHGTIIKINMNGLIIKFITQSGASAKIFYPCVNGDVLAAYFKTVSIIRNMYAAFSVVAVVAGNEVGITAKNWKFTHSYAE